MFLTGTREKEIAEERGLSWIWAQCDFKYFAEQKRLSCEGRGGAHAGCCEVEGCLYGDGRIWAVGENCGRVLRAVGGDKERVSRGVGARRRGQGKERTRVGAALSRRLRTCLHPICHPEKHACVQLGYGQFNKNALLSFLVATPGSGETPTGGLVVSVWSPLRNEALAPTFADRQGRCPGRESTGPGAWSSRELVYAAPMGL